VTRSRDNYLENRRIPDRVDELVGHWESFGKISAEIDAKEE